MFIERFRVCNMSSAPADWNESVSAFDGKHNMDVELGIGVCHGCYVSPKYPNLS